MNQSRLVMERSKLNWRMPYLLTKSSTGGCWPPSSVVEWCGASSSWLRALRDEESEERLVEPPHDRPAVGVEVVIMVRSYVGEASASATAVGARFESRHDYLPQKSSAQRSS
jgi:hypothetical protein